MTYLPLKELYALFLESDWWIRLSRYKRTLQPWCEKCESRDNLQSHHVTYPEHWFDTTIKDLQVLCRPCHAKEHGFVELDKGHGLHDSHIPKHAFISQPKPPQNKPKYPRKRMSKKAFRRLRKRMRRGGNRFGRSVPKGMTPCKRGLNFIQRRNWVNRGSSSN